MFNSARAIKPDGLVSGSRTNYTARAEPVYKVARYDTCVIPIAHRSLCAGGLFNPSANSFMVGSPAVLRVVVEIVYLVKHKLHAICTTPLRIRFGSWCSRGTSSSGSDPN